MAVVKNKIFSVAGVGLRPSFRLRAELAMETDIDFSSMKIALQPNYYDGFARRISGPRVVTVKKYLQSGGPTYANLMCVEMPVPNEFASKMELNLEGKISDSTAVSLFHAGRAGSIAPLHYDWDHKWVLHACLTGSKTLYFIPPDAGWLLNPIINTSAICVPRLSKIDRADFLRRLGGTEVKLGPGQAVLFPSVWWHAVRYETPSTSVSVRFGEQVAMRPFSVLPRSFWLQRLAWVFFQQKKHLDPTKYLVRCLTAFFTRGGWTERYYSANATYRAILQELRQPYGAEYLVSDNFNSEMYMATNELEDLYSLNVRGETPRSSLESVEDIRAYLFEGLGEVPYRMQKALAEYAIRKRQGLKPRRGLVVVHRKRGVRDVKRQRRTAGH